MLIALTSFIGTAPRINARKLPPQAAQIAVNVDLDDSTLGAIREPKLVHTFGSPVLSFFKDAATWLGFTSVVSIARGPVAQDRLYYTGDGAPKMRVAGTIYDLAIPAPVSAPTVTNLSVPSGSTEDVLYAYTWVTSMGEESQPSPLSAPISHSPGVTQRVSAFAATPAGRGIVARRIYRSQTSLTGATELFFAAEIILAVTQYDYDSLTTPLAEAITTRDFDPPPAGLSGLISMPNGMMAAFSGRELYFCEPYQPHAWPDKYILTVNTAIVGLAAFGSSVAVLTAGAPYVVQGLHPDQMAMEVVESGTPCLSGRGIVDVGYSAIYPSTDGIMLVGEGRRDNITDKIMSRDQWQLINPASIIASRFKNQYVFIHNSGAFDTYSGGNAAGWGGSLEADLLGGGAVASGPPGDYTTFDFGSAFSSFGAQSMSWVDAINGASIGIISSTVPAPASLFNDDATGTLYFLAGDNVSVYEWMAVGQSPIPAIWRSKVFTSNVPVAPGAFYAQTAETLQSGDTFSARVFANGTMIREITTPNAIMRLPGDRLARDWEVEIETSVPVLAAYLANSPDEIMVALQ